MEEWNIELMHARLRMEFLNLRLLLHPDLLSPTYG